MFNGGEDDIDIGENGEDNNNRNGSKNKGKLQKAAINAIVIISVSVYCVVHKKRRFLLLLIKFYIIT